MLRTGSWGIQLVRKFLRYLKVKEGLESAVQVEKREGDGQLEREFFLQEITLCETIEVVGL
jgi:hypothetical protein